MVCTTYSSLGALVRRPLLVSSESVFLEFLFLGVEFLLSSFSYCWSVQTCPVLCVRGVGLGVTHWILD